MSERTLFPREVVAEVCEEMLRHFDPAPAFGRPDARCERVAPMGGYRRRKKEMKDLELLFIPRIAETTDAGDLFGAKVATDVTAALIERLLAEGVLAKRLKVTGALSAWGPENYHALHVASGLALDLFAATAENWHNRAVVTTGPRELNVRIAQLAREKGWEWEVYDAGFVPLGKTWESATKERRTMRSEAEVFAFVGLEYLEPWRRK